VGRLLIAGLDAAHCVDSTARSALNRRYQVTLVTGGEARGIGSCLMDFLRRTLNGDRSLRKILGIGKQVKVLAVLLLGYSDEKVINIPQGYKIPIHRNQVGPLSPG
jgi:hypothetical protein